MTAKTPRTVLPADALVIPMHKAMFAQRASLADGAPVLRLFHGGKEIEFEEPELFGFAEGLCAHPAFVAGEVVAWAEGLAWERAEGLLQELLSQGVLAFAEDVEAEALALRPEIQPSPLPPAQADGARDWRDCRALMAELTGRPLDLGRLELVTPIFRIAHPFLDADGRQVGEGNVFPKPLRIDAPTEWRTAIYPGSRYQAARPMNLTALKAMREHWPSMMAVLSRARAAFIARCPEAAQGWTVGRLERFTTAVLALPTWRLMRAGAPDHPLHPVLSNVFRVTDGLRMTTHQMLFIPIGEAAWEADAPVTSAEIHDYAERNYSFHSEHGVCAGPRLLVQEFLSVIMDGAAPKGGVPQALDEEVEAALAEIGPAFDYGFLGLQAHAAIFSIWPQMARSFEAMDAAAERAAGSAFAGQVRTRLAAAMERIRFGSYMGEEPLRLQRERVYADMFDRCAELAGPASGGGGLAPRLAGADLDPSARRALARAAMERFGSEHGQAAEAFADAAAAFLARGQAALLAGLEVQGRINRLLGRAEPTTAFSVRDIDLYNALLGPDPRRLPFLLDEIEALLDLRIDIDERGARVAALEMAA